MAVRADSRFLIGALLLYGLIAVPTGVRRGTDFAIHVPVAQAWLEGAPLYASPPRVGMWWPPFAIVLVSPFAALAQLAGLTAAKAAWAVTSLACLGWALARLPKDHWRTVVIALLAVAVPLHRNFEDLNLNAFLLALWVGAVRDLDKGRESRAAFWLGTAAAIKVFPGLLLSYFVLRRRWRALSLGAVAAAALTLLPLLRYGATGAEQSFAAWMVNGAAIQASLRGSNQSLAALAARLELPIAGLVLLDASCVGVALIAVQRCREGGERTASDELGILALLAVLLSPIAWVHYFLLAFPAWVTAVRLYRSETRRFIRVVLVVAGVATSGVVTVFSLRVRDVVFAVSLYTWGALALLLLLAFAWPRAAPVTASSETA